MTVQQPERLPQDGFVDHGCLVDVRLVPNPGVRALSATSLSVTTRPMGDEDSMLLFELYAAARVDEISRSGWVTPQQRSFFRMQALRQEAYLGLQFDNLHSRVICINGFSAGRLLVDRQPSAFTLVDIGLLPGFRGLGIGSLLIRNLLDEAARANSPVHLEVDQASPIVRLLDRLGFGDPVDLCPRVRLTWTPPARVSAQGSPLSPPAEASRLASQR